MGLISLMTSSVVAAPPNVDRADRVSVRCCKRTASADDCKEQTNVDQMIALANAFE